MLDCGMLVVSHLGGCHSRFNGMAMVCSPIKWCASSQEGFMEVGVVGVACVVLETRSREVEAQMH